MKNLRIIVEGTAGAGAARVALEIQRHLSSLGVDATFDNTEGVSDLPLADIQEKPSVRIETRQLPRGGET